MHPLRLASLVCALALVLAACKKDSSNPTGTTLSINGTWTITGATVNGTPANPADIFEFVQGAETARFAFGSNGTFTYTELDAQGNVLFTQTGTFVVQGNNVTVTITHANGQQLPQPIIIAGTFAISGNTLTFTTNIQGSTVVLTFLRV